MSADHAPATQQRRHPTAILGRLAPLLLVLALAGGLLARWAEGSLTVYVNPDFVWLSLLSVVLLLVLALPEVLRVLLGRPSPGWQSLGWSAYLASGLVVALVLLLPPRPLGSAALDNQGTATAGGSFGAGSEPFLALEETASWTLLHWTAAWSRPSLRQRLVGKPLDVVGFVYHPRSGLPPEHFEVVRFVVRCCTADSNAMILLVRWPEAAALSNDTWVRVEGTLQVDRSGPTERAAVHATSVTPVAQPLNPYLSPGR